MNINRYNWNELITEQDRNNIVLMLTHRCWTVLTNSPSIKQTLMCLAYQVHWMKLKMSFIMSAFMYLDKEGNPNKYRHGVI